jgi:AraC-like DNA-binding protein
VLPRANRLLRGWLQSAFPRIALLYRPALSRRGVASIRDGFSNGASGKTRARFRVVEANYAEPITLKEAAYLAKMSVPQFVRIFKRIAGMSFVSYLLHVRLSRAVRLLKETCLTIAQIACEVGFADQSYFDRRFKGGFRSYSARLSTKLRERKSEWKRSTILCRKLQSSGLRNWKSNSFARHLAGSGTMKPIAASRLNNHTAAITCP